MYVGATQFIVYNHSITSNVHRLLQFYVSRGLLRILPWPLIPFPLPQPEYVGKFAAISNQGQIVNSNDCILRAANDSQFVALVDVDEYISEQTTLTNADWLVALLLR